MDHSEPNTKRNKKSDKAKRNQERTAGLSSKHIRLAVLSSESTRASGSGKKR